MGKCIAAHREDRNVYDTTDNDFVSANTLRIIKSINFENVYWISPRKRGLLAVQQAGRREPRTGPFAERTETRLYASIGPRTVEIAEK